LSNQQVCLNQTFIFLLEAFSLSDADQRQNLRSNQREQRTPVEHDLEKEKHALRLMKG
jgi:hypothetical protein